MMHPVRKNLKRLKHETSGLEKKDLAALLKTELCAVGAFIRERVSADLAQNRSSLEDQLW